MENVNLYGALPRVVDLPPPGFVVENALYNILFDFNKKPRWREAHNFPSHIKTIQRCLISISLISRMVSLISLTILMRNPSLEVSCTLPDRLFLFGYVPRQYVTMLVK